MLSLIYRNNELLCCRVGYLFITYVLVTDSDLFVNFVSLCFPFEFNLARIPIHVLHLLVLDH